ncbi:hypothetical protein N8I77_005981 [Diaporthe amygdali]|uniref:Uncharacterized protein n=1 Tax=Phomopsis amygdali TaxID=1214568 RepID=A0AAD9W3I4_PHOAM|nr:hypothetical protein N8I77_005981 [Diaporthe amygdali]
MASHRNQDRSRRRDYDAGYDTHQQYRMRYRQDPMLNGSDDSELLTEELYVGTRSSAWDQTAAGSTAGLTPDFGNHDYLQPGLDATVDPQNLAVDAAYINYTHPNLPGGDLSERT